MKRIHVIAIVSGGFAAGWLLPSAVTPAGRGAGESAVAESARVDRKRARTKQELLALLLTDGEQVRYKLDSASNLSELLPLIHGGSYDDSDIVRVVDMDPLSALNQLLADPGASSEPCEKIAIEWAKRDPVAAVRFLRSQTSYRGRDCLYQALVVAYGTDPGLVAEVYRTLPRSWQERHLKDFFSRTWSVREAGAPPEVRSEVSTSDPFTDDGHWLQIRPGKKMLESLADDRLREQARKWMEPSAPAPAVPEPEKPQELDLAGIEEWDSNQWSLLRERLKNEREKTIETFAESGNYHARAGLMSLLIGDFPMDRESWPRAFKDVEEWMDRLGVIPVHQPSHFELGPFLYGQEAAAWIGRQPVALQRAWASDFVETWVVREPRQAVDWALTLPAAAGRDQAFQSGMVVWAHREPLAAATYAAALPAGGIRESAISNAAAAWSCADRAGAKAWLNSLPESPGKQRGLERVK